MPEALNRAEIGRRVAEALSGRRLSQTDAARAFGVSQSFISCVVQGRNAPSVELLVGLYRHCGASPVWILLGERAADASEPPSAPPPLPHPPLPRDPTLERLARVLDADRDGVVRARITTYLDAAEDLMRAFAGR